MGGGAQPEYAPNLGRKKVNFKGQITRHTIVLTLFWFPKINTPKKPVTMFQAFIRGGESGGDQ